MPNMMRVFLFLTTLILCVSSSFALKVTERSQIKGNESEITEIDLSNTGLSEFPIEILACRNLVSLNLSDNGLINIPLELTTLERLKSLDLSGNQGISYADLGDIFTTATFRLTELNVANCDMGFLPQEIGKLKSLKKLNISGNMLNNLPYSIIQLTKMEDLNASNNRIDDMSWQVYQWWGLKNLDVSDNPDLQTDKLLFSLSVCDGLDRLVISHLKTIPSEFKNLRVKDLEIQNSHITTFNRLENSVPIDRLSFVKCTFQRPSKTAEIINDDVRPSFISFNEINQSDLVHFLGINTDSVDIRNNNLTDISALAGIRQLKWIDARGNNINESSILKVKQSKPNVELLVAEPVKPAIGINPPIEKFVKKPTLKSVNATDNNEVNLGRSSFKIEKNAFLDANGNPYKGAVQLAYTEYFSPTEVFLSGITMTSDSAGENLGFSSAGMFSLTASDAAGNELTLDPNKPIDVEMMSSDPSSAMNLYVLNDSGAWDFQGKDEIKKPFELDQAKIDAAADSAFLNYTRRNIVITQNRYLPSVRGDGDTRSFTIQFDELKTDPYAKSVQVDLAQCRVKRPTYAASRLARTRLVYDGPTDSVKYYKDWFRGVRRLANKKYSKFRRTKNYGWGINYITEMDLVLEKEADRMRLNFLFKDSAVSIPVVLESSPANPKARVKIFERFFKSFNREKRKDQLAINRRNRKAIILVKREEIEIRNMAREREANRQLMYASNTQLMNSITNVSSIKRGFQITGFGVWNCDQRQRMKQPTPLPRDFVADNGEQIKEGSDAIPIYIIDYDNNGVISFGDRRGAFYDKGTEKMAIVVFFSATMVGVYQSWKNFAGKLKMNDRQLPVKMLDITDMETGDFISRIES
jgi:Leucine-rich repeat (LRR) protein